jgi:hypothetical protein
MNATKIIGVVLIIASLFVGYTGYNKVAANSNEVKVIGIKIDASNESGKEQGYLYIGFAVVLFVGGIYSLNKSKS